ncbi:hypothetical protein RIF29_33174 [Crotalaria pallida]|uniref:Uncharacterized protein n=1 Tax=Crotalaria pallida TaxID=3830 RepID=A0AAN9HTX3_CROPI
MAPEAMLQLGILILTLSMIFITHNLRHQTTHTRTRTRNRPNRHVAQASRHLSLATRSTTSLHHAKTALSEADTALSINPRDPSAHIHRARALHLLGHSAAALKSLHCALSPPAARSLSTAERAEALVLRAELKVAVKRLRRIESAVKDLVEAVGLSRGERVETEALCLLGKCYEWKGMNQEAKEAFLKVLDVEPDSLEARSGLDRLGP